jgi:hypothetical protein
MAAAAPAASDQTDDGSVSSQSLLPQLDAVCVTVHLQHAREMHDMIMGVCDCIERWGAEMDEQMMTQHY